MQETIGFWCRCALHAAKGTVAFANDWAWLFGVPVAAAVLQVLVSGSGASVTGSIFLDALLTGSVAFVVTWFVIFFVRLLGAPAALYKQALANGITTGFAPNSATITRLPRPLPIALSVESLGSYMRTSPRVERLDETIAKMGRWEMATEGKTLAYGLFDKLKKLGVANVAEVDTLLEEKEELILHSATHWIMKDGVIRGQCVWELTKVMMAERGTDNYTKKIIDAYLAAKGTVGVAPGRPPSSFPGSLHISRIWLQIPSRDEPTMVINIDGFNGVDRDILLTSITGCARSRIKDSKNKLSELTRPVFFHLRNGRIEAHSEFHFMLAQRMPKVMAELMQTMSGEKGIELNFEELNINVQLANDESMSARLPLWQAVTVCRGTDGTVNANRMMYLRTAEDAEWLNKTLNG